MPISGIHIGGTDFDRLLSLAHVMPELGYLTPTKDGKRNLPAGYFVDLATWQRINLLYTGKAKTDLRQMRYEAARPDLVDRLIDVVDHRFGHALATLVERAKIALTDQPAASVDVDLTGARFSAEITRDGLEETIRDDVGPRHRHGGANNRRRRIEPGRHHRRVPDRRLHRHPAGAQQHPVAGSAGLGRRGRRVRQRRALGWRSMRPEIRLRRVSLLARRAADCSRTNSRNSSPS